MFSTTGVLEYQQPTITSICRCCLTYGCYKDITTEYYFSGHKEIYEKMLKETFDIQISHQKSEGPSCSRLICENCILRLRDAHSFKQTVLRSEENFNSYIDGLQNGQSLQDAPGRARYEDLLQIPLGSSIITEEEKPTESEMKLDPETVKIEVLPLPDEGKYDEADPHGGDNDIDFHDADSVDDDEILANIKMELTRADENVVERPAKRNKNSKGKRPKKRTKVKEINDISGKRATKAEKNWIKISERRGNGPILRENSLKLIANSTMCVFQWNKSRYRCFCCKEPFSDMNLLREHTSNKHTLENIEKKIIIQQNRLVKVEVSSLNCKICSVDIDNLIALRNHLIKTHDMQFELEEDLLVPFKIESGNLKCQICSETFTMFRLLNIHMNKHYQKQVCHICGAGFSNRVFLNLHKTRSHRPFGCKQCDLVFTNKIDKKEHDISVHNVKIERKLRFPCPYCNERFFQENFRVQHLVEKHGMVKPEHKCAMCSKVFITRSLCNNHVKNVHMKEKNHECDVCHHLFYTKSDVSRHRVTHTGEKKFCCSLCSNLFATKDSLRRHMKRTHVGIT